MLKKFSWSILTTLIIFMTSSSLVFADSYQDKLDFATSLEETLGHFWAIELNLDEKNAELALVHATHPIAELYDLMKPQLKETDPQLDEKIQETLMQLQNRANTEVSRDQAQAAIDEAKEVIENARSLVVGEELSNDTLFKAGLIKNLMETSVSEYKEAMSDGMIEEMAEFQDGSAFVWRSQQIFEEIKDDLDSSVAVEIEESYEDLWDAYEQRANPVQVETFAGGITHEIDEVLGVEKQENELLDYVENIENLLEQTKFEYANGNNDQALSLATKAYLDNFEFLEAPLVELGQDDLMEEVELMLREDLREMIRNGEPIPKVTAQIEAIEDKMDTIATVVPEFGTIAMAILAVSIISIIAITSKSKFIIRV